MATKSYKKKSIVAGSPAIQEHEAMMQEVMNEQPVNDTPAAPTASVPTGKGVKPTGVFSQYATGMTKNVQTRIPFDMYQRLLALKMQSEQWDKKLKLSIGDLVLQAIDEYLQRH